MKLLTLTLTLFLTAQVHASRSPPPTFTPKSDLQVVTFETVVLLDDQRQLQTRTFRVLQAGELTDVAAEIPTVLGANYRALAEGIGNSSPIAIYHTLKLNGKVISLEIEPN